MVNFVRDNKHKHIISWSLYGGRVYFMGNLLFHGLDSVQSVMSFKILNYMALDKPFVVKMFT